MSALDPDKMKVVELRAELSTRGLDSKGNKPVLVDRLKEALASESGQDIEGGGNVTAEKNGDSGADMDEEGEQEQVQVKAEADAEAYQGDATKDAVKQEPVDEKPQIKQEPVRGYADEVKTERINTSNLKTEVKKEVTEVKQEPRGQKRAHSPAPAKPSYPSHLAQEDEPEFDESAVLLDWYDSDMNLVINKDTFCKANPMSDQGWGFIWAGARATYGFTRGRICFEVKVIEHNDISHLEDEPNPHVVRVGWSICDSSMQLGEEPLSYGYGGTAKASVNCKFKDYGTPYKEGDTVGAYLDMESDPILMSFTRNGEPQGVAYEIRHRELNGKALFPHVLTKNSKFEVNFGQEDPWFAPLPGFTYVGHVPVHDRVRGYKRPDKKSNCEIKMMCGLPGCGKTTWANEWCEKNSSKKYNILGTNNLIDKMKVMGLPRKRNYAGRWDVLIDKCTKCLNKLLDMGNKRRRNFILDQTNVYPSAQRRKMKGFEGFIRQAVVLVPTDEEFKKRIAKREKEEGKDVPDSAVLEMKANFKLPEVGDIFSEVLYTELDEAESRKLVEQYNKEGRDAGYGLPATKRFRQDNNRDNRNRMGFQNRGRGNDRARGFSRGGGGGGGGWNRDNRSDGGYRSSDSNYSGSWRSSRDSRDSRDFRGRSGSGYDRDRFGGRSQHQQTKPWSGQSQNWGSSE